MVKQVEKKNTINVGPKIQQSMKTMMSIKKKSMELSSFCDIDVWFLCLGEDKKVEMWPENPNELKLILQRYKKEISKKKNKVSVTSTDCLQISTSGLSKDRIANLLDGLSRNSLKIFSNQIANRLELITNQLSSRNQCFPLLNSEEETKTLHSMEGSTQETIIKDDFDIEHIWSKFETLEDEEIMTVLDQSFFNTEEEMMALYAIRLHVEKIH